MKQLSRQINTASDATSSNSLAEVESKRASFGCPNDLWLRTFNCRLCGLRMKLLLSIAVEQVHANEASDRKSICAFKCHKSTNQTCRLINSLDCCIATCETIEVALCGAIAICKQKHGRRLKSCKSANTHNGFSFRDIILEALPGRRLTAQ